MGLKAMPKPHDNPPKTEFWRQRLIDYFKNNPDISMHGESKKAGFSASWVRDFLLRGHDPSISKVLQLCESMQIEPSILFDKSQTADDLRIASVDKWLGINELPIRAIASKNNDTVEQLSPMMQKALGKLAVNIDKTKDYPVLIDSEAFKPALYPGDVVVFSPIDLNGRTPVNRLIGRICLIRTSEGQNLIRVLSRDNGDGTFRFSKIDTSDKSFIDDQPKKFAFLRHTYTDLYNDLSHLQR